MSVQRGNSTRSSARSTVTRPGRTSKPAERSPSKSGTITRCTITNRLAVADLKIIKTVVNGSGLDETPGDFTFSPRRRCRRAVRQQRRVVHSLVTVCKTISYPVGATFSVVEVGIAEGYTQTGAVGCSGTIATTGKHVHHHQYRTAGAADDPDGPAGHPARFGEHRRRSPIRRRDRAAGDVRALSVAGGVQRRDGSARLRGQNGDVRQRHGNERERHDRDGRHGRDQRRAIFLEGHIGRE